jgi:uncharacterized protein involved in exopolysaccharide biosynthesis
VVLLVALLGAAAGAAISQLVPDQFVGQAQVRVLHDTRLDVLEDAPSDTYETVDEANRRMNSAAVVAVSDDVVRRAAEDADSSVEEVRDRLTVEPVSGADVLLFSGHANSADEAARLAQAAADAYVEVTRDSGRDQLIDGAFRLETEAGQVLDDAPQPVPAETSSYAGQLYARALDLRTRAAVYDGAGALVVEATVPTGTSAPGLAESAAYGLAAGLLAGVGAALLLSTRRGASPSGDPRETAVTGAR